MFDAIGFDPKTLTNEQLLDRQIDLARKKMQATRFGKADAVNQLQIMIEAIERERYERIFNERIGSVMIDASSVVVESDPALQEKQQNIEEEKRLAAAPPAPSYPKPVRTAGPATRHSDE